MTTPATLDLVGLAAPISETAPTGAPLRASTETSRLYSGLRDARTLAGSIERRRIENEGTPVEELMEFEGRSDDPRKLPDWDRVSNLAQDILLNYSKDLQAIVWLVDAQVRIFGLAGLRDGLRLCQNIVSNYWDSLHPMPENGEDDRRDTLESWNTSLPMAIDRISICETDRDLSYHNFQVAKQIERLDPDKKAERIASGGVEQIRFDHWVKDEHGAQNAVKQKNVAALKEVAKSIQENLATVTDEFEEVVQVVKELSAVLDSKLSDSISLTPILESVKKVQRWFGELSESKRAAIKQAESALGIVGSPATGSSNETTALVEGVSVDDSQFTGVSSMVASPGWTVGLALRTREDAFTNLLRVAEFFRSTEPHSPVSYALEQAVRWGRMPLPELLKDLISDPTVLNQMNQRMGILEPKDGEKG